MVLRVGVFVWASDHASTISEVVKDIIIKTPFSVLIVDDGSQSRVDDSLYSFEVKQGIESGRVWIIRNEKKRGRGVALARATAEFAKRGYTHLLSLKGDQRQSSSPLQALADQSKQYPFDVIVDHRSGLSLYPVFHLQNISFVTSGIFSPIEAQLRLYFSGVTIRQLVGRVYKPPRFLSWTWPSIHFSLLGSWRDRIVCWSIGKLGLARSHQLAMVWAWWAFLFWSSARTSVLKYNRLLYPGVGWIQTLQLTWRQFFCFGSQRVDQIYQENHKSPQFQLRTYGVKSLEALNQSSTGFILLQARVGNFELASRLLGIQFSSAVKKLNADRLESGDFELVPFLGRLVAIDAKPFELARVSKKPIVLVFGFKGSKQTYDIYALTSDGPKVLDRLEWATEYANSIEAFIRKYPQQWFNFFPIWSRLGCELTDSTHHLIDELELAMPGHKSHLPPEATL